MLQNFAVAWSLATFPVRALFKGYRALAWAFDAPAGPERPRPGVGVGLGAGADGKPGDGTRIEEVEMLPASARERLLKRGFVSSTLLWAPAAYAAAAANRAHWVSEPGAWMGFAWAAMAIWVVSVLAIRRAGTKQAAARAASPLARARRAVGGSVAAAVGLPRRVVEGVRAAPAQAASGVRAAVSRVRDLPGRAMSAAVNQAKDRLSRLAGVRAPGRVEVPIVPVAGAAPGAARTISRAIN